MKRVIFIVLSLIIVCSIKINSQIHFEVGAGYLVKSQNGNLLTYNSDGWLISASVLYNVSKNLELNGSLNYKSFLFNRKAYVSPLQYEPQPLVTDGDNLEGIGLSIGGRLIQSTNKIVNPFVSFDLGLNHYGNSYFTLSLVTENSVKSSELSYIKYSDEKYLIESTVGAGVIISPLSSFELILEGKLSYTHKVKEVFFPISAKVRINI